MLNGTALLNRSQRMTLKLVIFIRVLRYPELFSGIYFIINNIVFVYKPRMFLLIVIGLIEECLVFEMCAYISIEETFAVT